MLPVHLGDVLGLGFIIDFFIESVIFVISALTYLKYNLLPPREYHRLNEVNSINNLF